MHESRSDPHTIATAPSANALVSSICGVLAGWIAAGSLGPWGLPLQSVLMWAGLAIGVLAVRPRRFSWYVPLGLLVFVNAWMGAAARLDASWVVVLVLAWLAVSQQGLDRRLLWISAISVLGLALFRLALGASPSLWLVSDQLAAAAGHVTGWVTGRRMEIGASLAGLDFLVLMITWTVGWLASIERPSRGIGFWAIGAIVAGYGIYLLTLASTPRIARLLPPVSITIANNPYVPPHLPWSVYLLEMLPWGLPVIAALIQVLILVSMTRWATWKPSHESRRDLRRWSWSTLHGPRRVLVHGAVVLAVLVSVIGTLVPAKCHLKGKRFLAYQKGRLDWDIPTYDLYGQGSAGMFGMLPVLIQSLGGDPYFTPDLSSKDLQGVDTLLLFHPDTSLTEQMRQRVWQFVRDGGSLLIVTEGYRPEQDVNVAIGRLLQPTAIKVRADAAISQTGNWQQACQWLNLAVADSVASTEVPLLSDNGASLDIGWQARPLIIGRWGWSAPQRGAAWESTEQFASSEKLGDLILAAEQPFGKGTVVVLGDGTCLTNEGSVKGWSLAGGLLSYLANRPSTPQAFWRQGVTVICCLGLLVLLIRHPNPRLLAGTSLVLVATLLACHLVNHSLARVVPDGSWIANENRQRGHENSLAYIDASHLEAFRWQDWGFDSLNGLALNLMRGDQLTLMMYDMTPARLEKAGMLVLVAPARQFSRRERGMLTNFVRDGGVLICMVGAEQAEASRALLAEFQLRIPVSPVPTTGHWHEPEPMGRFRATYLNPKDSSGKEYDVGVSFFAGWPVESKADDVQILVAREDGRPIVVSRTVGHGTVVLIGDTGFAMNKNLEYFGGDPFANGYENAQFWHWLINRLVMKADWVPPPAPADKKSQPDETLPGAAVPEGGS